MPAITLDPKAEGNFCLIGTPIAHSLSPLIHETTFSSWGIKARYELRETTIEELAARMSELQDEGFSGWNVTMPLKKAIVPLLDEVELSAELIGAVNTVKNEKGHLIGTNTDGHGVFSLLRERAADLWEKRSSARVCVIGTGGAGTALYTTAAACGFGQIDVVKHSARGISEVHAHLEKVKGTYSSSMNIHVLSDEIEEIVRNAQVVIDATRAGMAPLTDVCNVHPSWLSAGQVVVEVVYHPRVTPLVRYARAAGASIIDGLDMLIGQALCAQDFWFGRHGNVQDIKEAVENYSAHA